MGFFSGARESEIERALIEQYTQLNLALQEMNLSDARKNAEMLMAQAKEMAQKEGGQDVPANYADDLLAREGSEPAVAKMLGKKRLEGVTNDDIRWWWNLHYLERYMMLASDNVRRLAVFMSALDAGNTPDQAAVLVRKTLPMYGNPEDTSNSSGDDRPLPFELKDRINKYFTVESGTDPTEARQRRASGTSVNAMVRAEMKAGRL